MFRCFLLLSCLSSAFAQPAADAFHKPPPDVDDALRTRISQFYQYHVDGKFRLAEPLVAEDSKDAFYAANKPPISAYKIAEIAYSDDFTKAKATIIGKMVIMIMGFGTKPMDVPFPSYWKLENGQWCWYINWDASRNTPFGRAGEKNPAAPADPAQLTNSGPDIAALWSKVKADRTSVELPQSAGASEQITISNQLPGAITVKPERDSYPGLEVKLDRTEIPSGQKAVATLRVVQADQHTAQVVRLRVEPTNQAIDVQVMFKPKPLP